MRQGIDRYRLNVYLIYIFSFMKGLEFYIPIYSLYIKSHLGSITNVTLIFSMFTLTIILFEVPTGVISDVKGRKISLILSSVMSIIYIIVLGFATNFPMFLLASVLNGISFTLASGTLSSLLYESIEKLERKDISFKKATAIQTSLWPIGASISSLIGGYLAEINFRLPIFVTLIGFGIALIIQLFLVETLNKSDIKSNKLFDKSIIPTAINIIRSNKTLKILFLVGFLSYSFGEVLHQLKPVYFEFKEIAIRDFGVLFAFTFGLSFLGSISSERFSRLLGDKKALIISSVLSIAFQVISVFTSGFFAGFMLTLSSFSWGLRWPIVSDLTNKQISSETRSTVISMSKVVNYIGFTFFSPIFGYLVDIIGINILYLFDAIMGFSLILTYFKIDVN